MTDFAKYIDPQPVRNQAVKIITSYGNPTQTWLKAAAIQHWIRKNIFYVPDPTSGDYIARAEETLECRGGDCEDIAILFCSLCEAVGVRSMLYLATNTHNGHAFAASYIAATYPNGLKDDLIRFYRPHQISVNAICTFNRGNDGYWLLVEPHGPFAGDADGLVKMGYMQEQGNKFLWTCTVKTYQRV